ncbi:MAG: YebC/PmpR family DNA-binding transcriptional regulator [Gemmatimonadetes bacterium]|nr:YebC/PmpR family DNA-binding transcriptional regulator [Gemmatimonadota bacterium]
MAGHSKWANIKRKKAVNDAARGKIFTKLIRELVTAARQGGGDPDSNARLRTAIDTARAANMPANNIDRAVKRGTGEVEGATYEEIAFEGYGPAGVALYIEVLTDNRNRTVAEIRHMLSKHGGSLGENGCVAWMFDLRGIIVTPVDGRSEDDMMELALEAGAEDIAQEGDVFQITTAPAELFAVKQGLEAQDITVASAELVRIPQNTVRVEGKDAEKMMKLMEMLEDQDDVQRVASNFDIPDELLQSLEG